MSDMSEKIIETPHVPASKKLPELTLKAFFLSILLTIIMAASNTYLGLKIGMTVAATIPAAVISMAILSLFKKSNILENNVVQITVSTGEALAAACVFTFPGLILLKQWDSFPFSQIAALLSVGGMLGVFFSIILRRALIVDSDLKFPEGIAAAEVLKLGDRHEKKEEVQSLLLGAIFSGFLKFGQSAFSVFSENIGGWHRLSNTVMGGSFGFSAIMVGAGYIVGIEVGLASLVGGIIGWGICVPWYAAEQTSNLSLPAEAIAMSAWASKVRIIGIGVMVASGVWICLSFLGSIKKAITDSMVALRKSKTNFMDTTTIPRTEKDIPLNYVAWGILGLSGVVCIVLHYIFSEQGLTPQAVSYYWLKIGIVSVSVLVLTFLITVVYGYIMGLVGSTNSPLSGMTIMGILFISLLLLVLFAQNLGSTISTVGMSSISLILAGFMASAIVVGAETLQDFKAGQLVGGTPWKLQVMLILGVVISACVMAPTLNVLLQAYGMGDVLPRLGMDPTQTLAAPKAVLISTIAQNVFGHKMDWTLLSIGIAIGAISILIDEILRRKGSWFRLPGLAVAFGIYMPLDIVLPVVLGGIISHLAQRKIATQKKNMSAQEFLVKSEEIKHNGLLVSAGMVAGESLIGLVIAILLVSGGDIAAGIKLVQLPEFARTAITIPLFVFLCRFLYKKASDFKKDA